MDSEHKMTATEKKLAILDILHLFGEMTDLKLLQFLTDQKIMNYFDMMFALNDLCVQGQCSRKESFGSYLYRLTPAGEEALSYFENKMPSSLRDQIASAFHECQDAYRQNREYPAEHSQSGRGEYRVQMRIMDKDMEMLGVTLSLPDEKLARQIEEKWPSIAQKVYSCFFAPDEEVPS